MSKRRKDPLREFLRHHPQEQLAEWLLAAAKEVPEFRQRLEFYAASHEGPEQSFAVLDEACEELAQLAGRLSGPIKVAELAPRALFLLEGVHALLEREQLVDAFHFCGKALWLVDAAMTRLAGESEKMNRMLNEFQALHYRICERKPVDPATLGERLYLQQVNSAHGVLGNALAEYEGLLGETGLKAYRKKLERAYRVVVEREPLEDRSPDSVRRHARETKMLRAWGQFTQDLDEQCAIALAFAMTPQAVLTVVRILASEGRQATAIEAARQGCVRFSKAPPIPLFEFLTAHYEAEGQFEQSLEYRWAHFQAAPDERSYRNLLAAAAPLRRTEACREEALEFAAARNNSLYARLLLLEGRAQDALDQAKANGATTEVWALLAAAFADSEPHTAIHLFFDCAKYTIRSYRANQYEQSSQFLSEAWKLASDVQTFQTFNARLKSFFGENNCPPRMHEAVERAGVPLDHLLKN